MPAPPSQFHNDQDQTRKVLMGDPEALAELRARCHGSLLHILQARGASLLEAEDVLADVWSDCVPDPGAKLSLLAKYGGRFSLLSWLAKVVGNRWIDFKRRGSKLADEEESDLGELPGCTLGPQDDALTELLRECVRSAFGACPSETLVFLRLVYLHGLTQREVGRMMGWSESKTSRNLSDAMEHIKKSTLQALKLQDPGLELSWDDFLGLCDQNDTGIS